MVDTVFFLLQFVGLAVLLHWALTHDKPDDSAAESGLLAMHPAAPRAAGKAQPRRNRALAPRRAERGPR